MIDYFPDDIAELLAMIDRELEANGDLPLNDEEEL